MATKNVKRHKKQFLSCIVFKDELVMVLKRLHTIPIKLL
jgi:hypothetical protein